LHILVHIFSTYFSVYNWEILYIFKEFDSNYTTDFTYEIIDIYIVLYINILLRYVHIHFSFLSFKEKKILRKFYAILVV